MGGVEETQYAEISMQLHPIISQASTASVRESSFPRRRPSKKTTSTSAARETLGVGKEQQTPTSSLGEKPSPTFNDSPTRENDARSPHRTPRPRLLGDESKTYRT